MGCSQSKEAEGEAFPSARVAVVDRLDVDGLGGGSGGAGGGAGGGGGGGRVVAFLPPPVVTLKVLVLGSSSVGKTSLVHRFCHNKFSSHYRATLGADFGTAHVSARWALPDSAADAGAASSASASSSVSAFAAAPSGGGGGGAGSEQTDVTLQLWDTAGQERYRSLGTAFYRGADAVVLVFDVTNHATFDDLEGWCRDFVDKSGVADRPPAHRLPFVLVGNKADCSGDQREVTEQEARALVARLADIPELAAMAPPIYRETSAKEGDGVADVFHLAASSCLLAAAARSTYAERNIIVGRQGQGPP